MSSFHDLNVPIVSFVGRPADWRKGLQAFLDALEIASKFDPPVRFSVWIVGGSEAEADAVGRYVSSRSCLREAYRNGNVVIWSRVENQSLAELYSRSEVVVMPSLREQFGLVAVEAMMSGTPVVGFATGGLPDVVLDEFTGVLVAENESGLLANTIAGFLRNPDRRRALAVNAIDWARFAFDQDRAFGAFEESYNLHALSATSAFPTVGEFQRGTIANLQKNLQNIFRENAVVVEDLTTSRHLSLRVNVGEDYFFCKQYALEPSLNATVYGVPPELNPRRSFHEYAGRVRFHADNNFAPRALMIDEPSRVIVFEWCPPADTRSDSDSLIPTIADHFRRYRPPAGENASRYGDAINRFADSPSCETLWKADLAAAALNAPTMGDIHRFQQTHPQMEIWRIGDMIQRGAWSLPAAVVTRMAAIAQFLVDRIPFATEPPALCHGGLKFAHILTRGEALVSCDFDGSRYVVGPFDEAHYVWHRMLRDGWTVTSAFRTLRRLLPSQRDRALGVCWFVVDLFFFDVLRSAISGKTSATKRFLAATDALPSLIDALLSDDEPVVASDLFAVGTEETRHPA